MLCPDDNHLCVCLCCVFVVSTAFMMMMMMTGMNKENDICSIYRSLFFAVFFYSCIRILSQINGYFFDQISSNLMVEIGYMPIDNKFISFSFFFNIWIKYIDIRWKKNDWFVCFITQSNQNVNQSYVHPWFVYSYILIYWLKMIFFCIVKTKQKNCLHAYTYVMLIRIEHLPLYVSVEQTNKQKKICQFHIINTIYCISDI